MDPGAPRRLEGRACSPDNQRTSGQLRPEWLGQAELPVSVRPARQTGEQPAAQHHKRDQAQLGIAGAASAAGARPPEMEVVLRRVGNAQRRAVHTEHGQFAPPMLLGRRRGPHVGGVLKEPREQLRSEALPRLDDGAPAHGLAGAAGRRQHEVEMPDDLLNRTIAQQSHADDDPDHVVPGSFRRRTVPVPVAARACAIHSGSSVSLKTSKLAARSPLPTASNACPRSIPTPPRYAGRG